MKKRPTPQKAESSALNSVKFIGTNNPRHLIIIRALLAGPVSRERVDQLAGVSNGPSLIADLRDCGLGMEHLQCLRRPDVDKFGKRRAPGVYLLTEQGRRAVRFSLGGAA
jgi:hypothetical protein